jgi:putative oxidoreductase
MKKFLFDCGTRDATASFGVAFLRIAISSMIFIGHGLPKIRHYGSLKSTFFSPDYFLLKWVTPELSLLACITVEVGAALLMIFGVATRPAAFLIGLSMVFTAFGFLGYAPWFVDSATLIATKEQSVIYLISMVAIIFTGAGSYSLDAVLYRESKRRRW